MYYRLIMEGGHVGSGKSIETVRYFRGENVVDLFSMAVRMPRAKHKKSASGVKLIQPVSQEEYERGIRKECENPYLAKRSIKGYIKNQERSRSRTM